MKKLRFILPLFAVLIVVGASAFTKAHQQASKTEVVTTYVYTGDNTEEQQRNPELYIKDNEALPCSGQPDRICLIQTSSDEGDHPDFSQGNPLDNPGMFEDVSYKPFQ